MTSRNSKQMIASTTTNRAMLRARTVGVALAIMMGTTAAFAADATIPTPSIDPGTVTFGGQNNVGSQTAKVTISNITVTTANINATAVGNNLSVTTNDKFASGNNLQTNSGTQTADVNITGQTAQFQNLTVNATAVGNNASYLGISDKAFSASTATQQNTGHQHATFTWTLDPSTNVAVNATAVGNNMSIGRN